MVSTGDHNGIPCGTLIGVMNDFLVSQIQLPPVIATMGTGTICAGLALLYTKGMPIMGLPHDFGILVMRQGRIT
jgi:ribose transport system permease protein